MDTMTGRYIKIRLRNRTSNNWETGAIGEIYQFTHHDISCKDSSNRSKKPICGFSTKKKKTSPRPVIVIGRSSPGKRSRARAMEQVPRQKAKRRSFCIESRLRPAFRPFEESLRCHTPFLVQQPMINMYVMQSFCCENRIAVGSVMVT